VISIHVKKKEAKTGVFAFFARIVEHMVNIQISRSSRYILPILDTLNLLHINDQRVSIKLH
jgi:hypothetical protein